MFFHVESILIALTTFNSKLKHNMTKKKRKFNWIKRWCQNILFENLIF